MRQHTKDKGDLAEIAVATDALRLGFKVAFPFGENWPYDLIVLRHGNLERVQVKHASRRGEAVRVKARRHIVVDGKVRETRKYTAETIDWLAGYDPISGKSYYIPAAELGEGMSEVALRLQPTAHNQQVGIRWAVDYEGAAILGPPAAAPAAD
jgi:hypothetical protein